jgi:hypothetical protein
MSTSNTVDSLVKPKGTKIPSTFKSLSSQINFIKQRPTTPLPPLVQTYYENGSLQVCAVIFIDASQTINNVDVYYDDTEEQPIFYATYNAPETTASEFNAYQVNFDIDLQNQPKTIITYVWDEDPVGSRGTTTTVQP